MSVREPQDASAHSASVEPQDAAGVEGERHIPSVNRVRSLHSRVSTILALTVMCGLGLGLLGWYYTHALERSSETTSPARKTPVGEPFLPRLGAVTPPKGEPRQDDALARAMGPPPALPATAEHAPARSRSTRPSRPAAPARELTGPVFTRAAHATNRTVAAAPLGARPASAGESLIDDDSLNHAPSSDSLATLLTAEDRDLVTARMLPTRRFLLPQGWKVTCTLETAIDSTLPGMTTCVTATDTWSVDGTVVLLERGTVLTGETRGQVRQGMSRLFVLWTRARTPEGVVIDLDSPGTDTLGRAGLTGEVDRHFFQRFGAALLVSTIDGVIQAATRHDGDRPDIVFNARTSQDVLTEVLRSTINIPPTVKVPQGDPIQILVARDLDFRRVYELRLNTPQLRSPP